MASTDFLNPSSHYDLLFSSPAWIMINLLLFNLLRYSCLYLGSHINEFLFADETTARLVFWDVSLFTFIFRNKHNHIWHRRNLPDAVKNAAFREMIPKSPLLRFLLSQFADPSVSFSLLLDKQKLSARRELLCF